MHRIFHPIGQGAFYSEHFENDPTVVFDCGSLPSKEKILSTKISSSFHKGQKIDLLFISHFHADHINCLELLKRRCKISKVVIPYMDETAKMLIKFANLLEGYSEFQLIDDAQAFFGDETEVFTVSPMSQRITDGIQLPDAEPGSGITMPLSGPGNTIESGSPITLGLKADTWFYVPFNFQNKSRRAVFEAALVEAGIDINDLHSLEAILKLKPEIIKAYKAVESDLNLTSLVVYSGRNKFERMINKRCNVYPNPPWHFRIEKDFQSGCLYTGDADLNENEQIAYLHAALRPVLECIGTIQAPHHGAINNHNRKFYEHFNRFLTLVCCFGTANAYGHPSDLVIAEGANHYRIYYEVTEETGTRLIQTNEIHQE